MGKRKPMRWTAKHKTEAVRDAYAVRVRVTRIRRAPRG